MKPKPRVKRLYRVTARFPATWFTEDGEPYEMHHTRTWHYQDKRAAEHRAEISRTGLPAIEGDHRGPGREAMPAAEWVRIEESYPITWPEPATT